MKEWLNNKETFEIKDVRQLKQNFLPAILKKARNLEVNNGFCIVQSFEPIPLYSALAELGYEHETEKVNETEYRVYFFRVKKTGSSDDTQMPFKPTAIVNLFGAYSLVKELEQKGIARPEIINQLMDRFGEKNPEVSTFFKGTKK